MYTSLKNAKNKLTFNTLFIDFIVFIGLKTKKSNTGDNHKFLSRLLGKVFKHTFFLITLFYLY